MKRIAVFIMMFCLAAFVCASGSNTLAGEESCTRENLTKITDIYFEAIQAHKTTGLPLAPTVKFTENGIQKDVGKGFWETAGRPLLRRTLIDTQKCTTATVSVMEEPFDSKTIGSGMMAGGPGMGGGAAPGAGAPAPAKTPAGAPGNSDAVPTGSVPNAMFGGVKEMPKEGTVRPILFANRLKVENGNITEIETIIAREKDFAFNADGVLKTKDQDWETILAPEKQAPRKALADAANSHLTPGRAGGLLV